jgi:hypothetical protein
LPSRPGKFHPEPLTEPDVPAITAALRDRDTDTCKTAAPIPAPIVGSGFSSPAVVDFRHWQYAAFGRELMRRSIAKPFGVQRSTQRHGKQETASRLVA